MMRLHLAAVLVPALLFGVVKGECGPGISGIVDEDRCCAAECGSCGGDGCSDRPGGELSCCLTSIEMAAVSCYDTGEGPCMMAEPAGEQKIVTESTCSNGFPGFEASSVCCSLACGACGGVGCNDFGGGQGEGLGQQFCCTRAILDEGRVCSDTVSAPCVIGGSASSSPNSSPTPIMTIPTTCELSTPVFVFDEHVGIGGRMYAEGEGCFTMADLYNFGGEWNDGKSKGPVFVLDNADEVDLYPDSFTGKWLLTSELYVTGGGTFYCRGTDIRGDCDELRIESTGSDAYHEVRGYGGNLYFENTVVTSWDTPNKEPQVTYEGGRSFINCVSEKLTGETCTGMAKNDMGECRMDIINSEMGYMGFDDSESYGLTWKVRGFCTDLSNLDLFDDVNVYGDIKGSDIHHMYYGMYSYGHQGGIWTDTLMHDNIVYGFDPHDDSDYLTIARNTVYNNINHGIIASKRCNNLKIYDNTIYDGGAVGIFLHRSGNDCEVYGNVITNMQDAGIALMESSGNDIHDNFVDGAEFGIRLHSGANNNEVHDNKFNDISGAGLLTYFGSDPPWVGDGRPFDNAFFDNAMTNTKLPVKLKDCDGLVIRDNEFTGNEEIEFNDAQDTVWYGNSLSLGACLRNRGDTSTFTGSSGLPEDC